MTAPMVFCADPLRPRQVDEHFAAQADAVRAAGGRVALIDHDALLSSDTTAAVRRVPADLGPVFYRGWMIPTGHYDELAAALADRGAELLTSADAYRRAHELPGWYPTFAAVTPASAWSAGVTAPEVPAARGPAIVKDFVKSRKHEWDEACYVPDLADAAGLRRVVDTFVERQDDSLAGGVVIRVFEQFTGGEARVWWLDGEPIVVGPHPDTPAVAPDPDLAAVQPLVKALDCPFVTTDLARRTDGRWRVVEVGDGQVSDLPSTVDPARVMVPLLEYTESVGGRR